MTPHTWMRWPLTRLASCGTCTGALHPYRTADGARRYLCGCPRWYDAAGLERQIVAVCVARAVASSRGLVRPYTVNAEWRRRSPAEQLTVLHHLLVHIIVTSTPEPRLLIEWRAGTTHPPYLPATLPRPPRRRPAVPPRRSRNIRTTTPKGLSCTTPPGLRAALRCTSASSLP